MMAERTGVILLLFLIIVFVSISNSLHCFSHDHCGNHAVCVSVGAGQTPRCMCLVGFVGNGARCDRLDSTPSNATSAKIDQLVLQKSGCSTLQKQVSSSREDDAPPGIRPPGSAQRSVEKPESRSEERSAEKRRTLSPDQKSISLSTLLTKTPVFEFSHEATKGATSGEKLLVTPPPLKGIANTKACSKVVCNFDSDACRYRSLGDVSWIRKPKKTFGDTSAAVSDFAASTQPGTATDQYLASENFVLLEQAEFSFKYFESDHSSHLQVCDNDLSHCFWQSDGSNGKWADVNVVLPSGTHRIIFAVSDIGPGKAVAIDDVRLESNGEQAVCV